MTETHICARCRAEPLLGRANHWRTLTDLGEGEQIQNLFVTNDPATPSQIAYLKATILPDIDEDLTRLEKRLDALHAAIDALEEEKDDLLEVAHDFKMLVLPFRRLPVELLSNIIWHAHEPNVMDPEAPQWQFEHVSRAWRAASLSCHSIWSSIHLGFTIDEELEGEPFFQRLEQVVSRSGQVPLDIRLWGFPEYFPYGSDILATIFAQSHRWRTADITLNITSPQFPLQLVPLTDRLPLLQTLAIVLDAMAALEKQYTGFSSCPSLRSFTYLGGEYWPSDLPWTQITTLNIAEYGWANWVYAGLRSLISACTSLETFHSYTEGSRRFNSRGLEPTQSRIMCTPRKVVTNSPFFLGPLGFSRLEELVCSSSGSLSDDGYTIKRLSQAIGPSGFSETLTSLRLAPFLFLVTRRHNHHNDKVVHLLRQMKNLMVLDIQAEFELDFSESDFSDSEDENDPWKNPHFPLFDPVSEIFPELQLCTFLPKLSCLRIRAEHRAREYECLYAPIFGALETKRTSEDTLLAALRSRWWHSGDGSWAGVARLQEFCLDVSVFRGASSPRREPITCGQSSLMSPSTTEALEGLISEGMDVAVRLAAILDGSDGDDYEAVKVVHAIGRIREY